MPAALGELQLLLGQSLRLSAWHSLHVGRLGCKLACQGAQSIVAATSAGLHTESDKHMNNNKQRQKDQQQLPSGTGWAYAASCIVDNV